MSSNKKQIVHNGGAIEVSVYSDDTYLGWAGSKGAYHYVILGSIPNDAEDYQRRLGELIAKAKGLIDRLRVKEELANQRLEQAVEMASQVIDGDPPFEVKPIESAPVMRSASPRRGFFSALRDSRRRG